MLKKLILKNFQIHKSLKFEFDKRFNVIVGSNDRGKSSIIRAINWVFFNEPAGDWMCRINSKGEQETCSVKIVFEDDTVIIRRKGEGVNSYEVDGDTYENFGYNVPPQVLKKLKIFPFKTNKAEFNIHIAMQDEHPFLVHESGPVKASVLDVLTGNSILQKSIVSFNKQNLQISKDLKTVKQNIEDDKEALTKLPDIDLAQKLLDEVFEMEQKKIKLKDEIASLKYINNRLEEYESTINNWALNIDVIDIDKIETLIWDYQNKSLFIKELKTIHKALESYQEDIVDIPDISKLDDKVQAYKELEHKLDGLTEIEVGLKTNRAIIKNINSDLEELEDKLKRFYKKNPTCPTCGRKW